MGERTIQIRTLPGKEKNKHESKKQRLGRGTVGKTAVIGMRERGGRTKAKALTAVTGVTLHETIHDNVEGGSELHTDEHLGYQGSVTTTCMSS